MASKKDYYELLGVPRGASDKKIKAAYRRLARKHHPDVNKGDRGAEERFKEISEAFAVLSDPNKRAAYDRGGHAAFGPGFDPFAGFDFRSAGLGDLSDLLGGLFGGFAGFGQAAGRGRRAQRGSDLHMEMSIPFVDAVRGATLNLVVPRQAVCDECSGSGTAGGSRPAPCPDCGGSGQRRRAGGPIRFAMPCSRCGGSGRSPGAACARCGGQGRRPGENRVTVRIPAGVSGGDTVRLAGKGDAGAAGAPPGDLFLKLRVEPHESFRRQGRDLYCDVTIGLAQAALGTTVRVQTLDGSATIRIPPGTPSGKKFRLRGKGVPSRNGGSGDLFAVIQIQPPEKLDKRSRELLEELRGLHPDPS